METLLLTVRDFEGGLDTSHSLFQDILATPQTPIMLSGGALPGLGSPGGGRSGLTLVMQGLCSPPCAVLQHNPWKKVRNEAESRGSLVVKVGRACQGPSLCANPVIVSKDHSFCLRASLASCSDVVWVPCSLPVGLGRPAR